MIILIRHRRRAAEAAFEKAFGKDADWDELAEHRATEAYNRYAGLYNRANIIEPPGPAVRNRYGYGPEHRTWDELPWRERMLINLADQDIDRVMARELERILAGDRQDAAGA